MARVLTTASAVQCGHGGPVSTTGEPKLRVAGAPVLLEAGIQGKTVAAAACTLVEDTSKGLAKCKTVTAVTGGRAAKLSVAGAPVILDTLSGGTNGVKSPPATETALRATAGQSKLEAS